VLVWWNLKPPQPGAEWGPRLKIVTFVSKIDYLTDGWCGPYFSDNKFQRSVKTGSHKPKTALGLACKRHDNALASGVDWIDADLEFIESSQNLGTLGKIYSKLVDMRGKKTPGLRGSVATNQKQKKNVARNVLERGSNLAKATKELRRAENAIVTAPVNISRKVAMAKPKIKSSNGSVVVSHSEYIGTVSSSATFAATTYPINPGLAITFPWLSNLAVNYVKYRFKKLQFLYVPAVGTATSGRVALAFDSNVTAAIPVNKQQMFSIAPNDEEAVWNEVAISVDTSKHAWLYVRQFLTAASNTIVNTSNDPKMSDCGRLIFAADLASGTVTCGELYVNYTVELVDPTAVPILGAEIYSTSSTVSNLFPSASTTVIGNGLISDTYFSDTVCLGASGTYLWTLVAIGTGITASSLAGATTGTISLPGANNYGVVNAAATEVVTVGNMVVTVDPTAGVAYLQITITATTVTSVRFNLAAVPALTYA